jgi:hypothetical protein
MPFERSDLAPEDTKVAILIRVPWRAREELRALAEERAQSFNAMLCEMLQAASGVELS